MNLVMRSVHHAFLFYKIFITDEHVLIIPLTLILD